MLQISPIDESPARAGSETSRTSPPGARSRRWEFQHEPGDHWTWRLVDGRGRPLAHNERRFASYEDCLRDARRYGYCG